MDYVVETLRKLEFLDDVHVSTDDEEIAQVAEDYGATCLEMRSPSLADDVSGFIDLIHRDIPLYSEAHGGDDEVLFVLAIAVLVPEDVYREAYQVYREKRPEIVISCEPFDSSPYWALAQQEDGRWKALFPEMVKINSQDLPKTLSDAGLFYYFDLGTMAKYHSVKLVPRLRPFVVPHEFTCDVDTPDDRRRLEEKLGRLWPAGQMQ